MSDPMFLRGLFGSRAGHPRRWLFALFATAAIGSNGASLCAAQDDDAAVIGAARALAVEGFKLAQTDQCGEAIDKLERAEKLHHAAMVSARLGECYIKQGRLVEGVERLRNVLREPLPANPSDALQQAYATSKTLLEATRPKLAALNVSIDVASAADLDVTIDGHPIPSALLGAARPTDPGEHVIKASAPGYLTASRRLTLAPGEEVHAELALVIDASIPRAHAAGAAAGGTPGTGPAAGEAAAQNSAAPASKANLLPAVIVWGASVAALGAGIGFGIAAMNNRADLRAMCPGNICTSSQEQLLQTARTNATLSTVGYATAIGGAAIGSVLYFMLGREDTAPQAQASNASHVSARVGLANAEMSVTF